MIGKKLKEAIENLSQLEQERLLKVLKTDTGIAEIKLKKGKIVSGKISVDL